MQKKLFIAFVIILLMGILLTGFFSLAMIKNSYIGEIEKKLISNVRLIEELIDGQGEELNEEQLQIIAETYGNKIQSRITFIDGKGNVLGDTFAEENNLENHWNRPEVQEAFNGQIGKSTRYSNTMKFDMLYVAVPVHMPNQKIKVIRMAVSLDEINKIYREIYVYIGISILFGLASSIILGYRFIGQVIKPIKEITNITKKIADGGLNRRAHVLSDDEIGELATHFNYMADRLQKMIHQLSDNNTKMKALLTSIMNPIIAVDHNHHILLMNPAAEKLLRVNIEEALGKSISKIIQNHSLDPQIKSIFEENTEGSKEIVLKDSEEKTVRVYTNPIRLEEDPTKTLGVVALIEDITEIRKLEKIRSDFVANVSHELRTPLTSISGFIETLKSGTIDDENTKKRFLDIIDIETERLSRLIDDILTLSEIENASSKAFNQKNVTNEAIMEVVEMMKTIASSKEISFDVDIEGNLPLICVNVDWFKQMIINLIDNGIKYTPKGGKVYLKVYQKDEELMIVVKDTGIGIPKQDLPRLFERFYRVDKARSRKIGGTGLGLAIVKHIVLAMNGKIWVKSELDKGSEFKISIPIKS